MSTVKHVLACAPFLLLAACSQKEPAADGASASGNHAHAVIADSAGTQLAVATLSQDSSGTVHLTMHAQGLAPGEHGVHIHAVGTCTPPDFASAGGHFNPDTTRHHGLNNPAGPHAGDLPNMLVDSTGSADYTAETTTVSLADGTNSVFDADGSAIVIHSGPDDNMNDPSGNSGSRVGCGVIQAGAPATGA